MLALRDYQIQALTDLFDYWDSGKGIAPVAVMPTGSGKSLVISAFCQKVCTESPHIKILIVTHTKELISQNEKELRSYYPEASTGVYSAGLGKRQTQANIVFCGIQSVYAKAFYFGRVDILIVDEAHCISKEANTRYGKFIADLKIANPHLVLLGLTATPFRLDSGLLTEGDDRLFDGIAHVTELKSLINQGYLVTPISKGGIRKIDLTNVHLQAGDYKPNELAHAADDPELVKLAVEEIVTYGQNRKAWLVYASGILHAEHVMAEIKRHGIPCKMVTGETPTDERDAVIGEFRNGKLKALVNVMVLTTGFNAPVCDMIALLTATKSTGKYVQICGRGLRTYPGKKDCLILDFGNNVVTHGPLDEIDPIKKKNVFCVEKKAPPQKECPQCHAIVHARATICICGYEFPIVASHGTEAYSGAVISGQVNAEIVPIAGVWVSRHKKNGSPDMVKVTYFTKLDKEYYSYLGLDHGGYYAEKSLAIVKRFGGKATTVNNALKESDYWRKPVAISVKPRGKWWDVVGIVFDDKIPKPAHEVQNTLDGGIVDDKFWGKKQRAKSLL